MEDSGASLTPTCVAPWGPRSPCTPTAGAGDPGPQWRWSASREPGIWSTQGQRGSPKRAGPQVHQTQLPPDCTAAPRAPGHPPEAAPYPPIRASSLALRGLGQGGHSQALSRVWGHRAPPEQGTVQGPLAPDREDMSTRNSQELPPPGCHQQGRAHPTSERQVSGRGRRRQPQEGPKPRSPGSRLLLPLGPTRPHAVSAQGTPPVQPVLRRQAPLPPRWPQCRRGAGWPGSTNGHRRAPALPRPPLPTVGPLPAAPPPPAQARVGSGSSAIHSLEGGPGQALTRGRARLAAASGPQGCRPGA